MESVYIVSQKQTLINCMDTNMKAPLCVATLKNAVKAFPGLKGAIVHSDRGTQYTSETYRKAINKYGITQSINSDGGRCHDNARCESMWARMKSEFLYDRYDTEKMLVEDVKVLIWRYFKMMYNVIGFVEWFTNKTNREALL